MSIALETQMDDLISVAHRRMAEHGVMLTALEAIAALDPQGIGCRENCKCLGCIARHALQEVRREK